MYRHMNLGTTFRVVGPAMLVLLWGTTIDAAPPGPAASGPGQGTAAGGTAGYFRLVPVPPQGANAAPYPDGTIIDPEAGTISFPETGPQRVWLEARFGGWAELGRIETYQFSTVELLASTGGLLRKADEACTPGDAGDAFCRGEFGDGPPGDSGCDSQVNVGTCFQAFPQLVNGSPRPDYLDLQFSACDSTGERLRCGGAAFSENCAADDGTEKYAGTIVVETTEAVAGLTDIPVDLLLEIFTNQPVLETFFLECGTGVTVAPSTLTGAVIRFRAGQCESGADCNDEDPCTTDTCLPEMTCDNAPIPNCPAVPTAITYQGLLEQPAGAPVTNTCDFRFGLWDAETGGSLVPVEPPASNPFTSLDVEVRDGVFRTAIDFGPGAFDGRPRWLELEVQCPGDPDFVLLSPREPIRPVPYAIRATQGVGPANGVHVTDLGRVGIGTKDPAHPLQVGTSASDGNGAHVTAGGVWTNGSDRNSKQSFEGIDKKDLLRKVAALPINRWRYKSEPEHVRHIGPVAQDFFASFGTGADERFIGTVDADGVALAAIQGLYQIVQEKEREIQRLRQQNQREIEELRAQVSDLRRQLNPPPSRNGGER